MLPNVVTLGKLSDGASSFGYELLEQFVSRVILMALFRGETKKNWREHAVVGRGQADVTHDKWVGAKQSIAPPFLKSNNCQVLHPFGARAMDFRR